MRSVSCKPAQILSLKGCYLRCRKFCSGNMKSSGQDSDFGKSVSGPKDFIYLPWTDKAETIFKEQFGVDPFDVFPEMMYVSQTLPGVARGPHEHVEQTDIFIFMGPGTFKVYLWDSRENSETFGEKMVSLVPFIRPCSSAQ